MRMGKEKFEIRNQSRAKRDRPSIFNPKKAVKFEGFEHGCFVSLITNRLAADLQREFPELAGYSARNLKYMRGFAAAWPNREIVQQLAAQMPWGHNCSLLDRVKAPETRVFYIRKTIEHGWSRPGLIHGRAVLDAAAHAIMHEPHRGGRSPDAAGIGKERTCILRYHPAHSKETNLSTSYKNQMPFRKRFNISHKNFRVLELPS